jgi:hypothetical protein
LSIPNFGFHKRKVKREVGGEDEEEEKEFFKKPVLVLRSRKCVFYGRTNFLTFLKQD